MVQQAGAGLVPVNLTVPISAPLLRYQLHSQEEAKERRHSHAISSGLPESDDQQELPSPPALPMALVGKGPLTSIGQCPPPPAPFRLWQSLSLLPPIAPCSPCDLLMLPWVLLFLSTPPAALTPSAWCFWPTEVLGGAQGPGMSISSTSGHLVHPQGSARGSLVLWGCPAGQGVSPVMLLPGPTCSWRVWGVQGDGLGLLGGDSV